MARSVLLSMNLVFGVTLALVLLTGRWSIARILDVDPSIAYEPRTWLVSLMVLVAVGTDFPGPPRIRRSPTLVAFASLITYLIASTMWAPDRDLAQAKALELGLMGVAWTAVHRYARFATPTAVLARLWSAMFVLLAGMALLALLTRLGTTGRIAVLGGGPNVFGRNMALLTILCTSATMQVTRPAPWFVGATAAGLLTILSGSRGALVACLVGMSVLFYLQRTRPARVAYVMLGLAIVVAVAIPSTELGQSATEVFQRRVLHLTLEREYDSGRAELYRHALEMGHAAPVLGQGLAAFAASEVHVYPHNLVLEVYAESGVVGVVALGGLLVPAIVAIARRRCGATPLDQAGFTTWLVAAQFSGDLYDARGVLLFALLLPMMDPRRKPGPKT